MDINHVHLRKVIAPQAVILHLINLSELTGTKCWSFHQSMNLTE